MRLVFGDDANVAEWVRRRIPHMADGAFVEPLNAIGVVDSDGIPVAGVVFNQHSPGVSMEASMAASTPRWAQRGVIRAILSYPFLQLGVNKVYTVVPHTSVRTLRFLNGYRRADGSRSTGIGFVQEAVLAQHFGHQPKVHAVISRLFRHEYLRRYWPNSQEQPAHGKIGTEASRAA